MDVMNEEVCELSEKCLNRNTVATTAKKMKRLESPYQFFQRKTKGKAVHCKSFEGKASRQMTSSRPKVKKYKVI